MDLNSPRPLIDQARDIIRGCVVGDRKSTLTIETSEDLAIHMMDAFHCGVAEGERNEYNKRPKGGPNG